MIQNIAHFIWFLGPKSRDFSLINAMAIQAVAEVQKPDAIYMHCNAEPVGNPHWDRIKPLVTIVLTEVPTEHKGVALEYPQYQADLVRLQILAEQGGIYLDTDTLLIKPLPKPWFKASCILSPDKIENPQGMNAGLIMAEPNAPFILKWLEALEFTDRWAESSSAIPWTLYQADPSLVKLVGADQLIPFAQDDPGLFGTETAWMARAYAVHVWESYWHGHRAALDETYFALATNDNCLTRLFSKYLPEPKRLKIAVYAIAKQESSFVERFCKSAADADLIFIADTGSTDDTLSLAEKNGAKTASIHISPWRFDDARNAALALLPADIDVCVSLDLDEELQPGWRAEIERVWKPGTTRLRYGFDWGCGIQFQYEKIHARKGYRWHHPVHEYPIPDRTVEVWVDTQMLLVIHKPDPTKSRSQYLDLLRMSIEEEPTDPRNGFYYCRELSFNGHWEEAITQAKRYLALPGATWDGERCYAMRVIARCHSEMGNSWEALNWGRRACAEAPNTREPWVEVAKLASFANRWAECYGAAQTALAITDRAKVYTCDPQVWTGLPYDLAGRAAWHLGLLDESLRLCLEASRLSPESDEYRANAQLVQTHVDARDGAVASKGPKSAMSIAAE